MFKKMTTIQKATFKHRKETYVKNDTALDVDTVYRTSIQVFYYYLRDILAHVNTLKPIIQHFIRWSVHDVLLGGIFHHWVIKKIGPDSYSPPGN